MSSLFAALTALDKTAWRHAFLLALSSWLSFVIATVLGVEHAYWAAMPVWVLAQATRGLVFERAFYRLVGTGAGALIGLLIISFSPTPWQPVWMALAVFCSIGLLHSLHGVRSYMALMLGITIAVVVMPALLYFEDGMQLAWARVQCTLIGVSVTTLITGFGTPKSARDEFYLKVRTLAVDAAETALLLLTSQNPKQWQQKLSQIHFDLSALEAQTVSMAAGSVDGHKRNAYVEALLFATLETVAAAQHLHYQIQRGMVISPAALQQLEDVVQRFKVGQALEPIRRQAPERYPDKVSLARLRRALGQVARAEAALFAESYPWWRKGVSVRRFEPARNWVLARRAALIAGGAALTSSLAVYFTQNVAFELAATGICIFSMILGSMPRPQAFIRFVMTGACIGAVVAAFYRIGLQPYFITPVAVCISLIPFVVLAGIGRVIPSIANYALDAIMCFLIVSQLGGPVASIDVVLQGASALIAGVVLTCGAYKLLTQHSDKWARFLIGEMIKTVQSILFSAQTQPVGQWRARMARHILRLSQWMGADTPIGSLGLFNLGYSLIAWQRLSAAAKNSNFDHSVVLSALADFAHHPDHSQQVLLRVAAQLDDATLADALYDMADALVEAKPVLLFWQQAPGQ